MRRLFLIAGFIALPAGAGLWAQMAPSAPVKDFRVPRFGDEGFTQWVLQGGEGIYDGPEQVRVKDMALRVYSGDERLALELSLDSPAATIRLRESRAFSEAPIKIVGANFTISGSGWTWEGEEKVIQVKSDTRVEFSQALSDSLDQASASRDAAERTVITSTGLRLTTTEETYTFEFTRDVSVRSDQMTLQSNALMAVADAPRGEDDGVAPVAPEELDSVRVVYAQDEVVIRQSGREIRAGHAEFYPREDRVILKEGPEVLTPGAFLSGSEMRSSAGLIEIEGKAGEGRAQMILTETGGLGIAGGGALAAETIVLADRIRMRALPEENEFAFEGSVEVLSGALQVNSERMVIRSVRAAEDGAETGGADGESLRVGEVREIRATGSVVIDQSGQTARADEVVFYPGRERAELSGKPQLTNGEAVLKGERIDLKPGSVLVSGTAENPVLVSLPDLPDLGYRPGAGPSAEAAVGEGEAARKALPTRVTSRRLEMIENKDLTVFRFTDDVTVTGTNLEATARRLEVRARPAARPADPDASLGADLEVEKILALGDVVVMQEGRVSSSEQATILPREGRLVLEGNAVVSDERGKVSGHRLTLLQGERRALVEGGGPDGRRATIQLQELPGQ